MNCGHRMHGMCLKKWYIKNEDPTCPMCRGPFRFKGFLNTLDKWDSEREDFEDQIIENHMEDMFGLMEEDMFIPGAINFWFNMIKEEQVLYNTLKTFNWEPEWIQEYLEDDIHPWISPRRLTRNGKPVWYPITKPKPAKRFFNNKNKRFTRTRA